MALSCTRKESTICILYASWFKWSYKFQSWSRK